MATLGIGGPRSGRAGDRPSSPDRPGGPDRELGAEHRGQAHRPRRLGEAHHSVEPVVIAQGQRLEAEMGGLLHQFLGMRGSVEEAEIGVGVQLGVGNCSPATHDSGLVRESLARPRRSIAAVTGVLRRMAIGRLGGLTRLARSHRTVAQPAFDLTPGNSRIVEPHPCNLPNRCSIRQRRLSSRSVSSTARGPMRRNSGGRSRPKGVRPRNSPRPRRSPR